MPCSHVHLGLEERRRIHRLREAKVPVAEIAAAPDRRRSTIHSEIARNGWHDVEVPQAEGCWLPTAARRLHHEPSWWSHEPAGCDGGARAAPRWGIGSPTPRLSRDARRPS